MPTPQAPSINLRTWAWLLLLGTPACTSDLPSSDFRLLDLGARSEWQTTDQGARADSRADRQGPTADLLPPPRPYPDVSAAKVNCTTWSVGDKVKAIEIYDAYFGNFLPKSEADFQWHEDPSILTAEIVERVAFWEPGTGLGDAEYHKLFDFNPASYSRTTTKSNWEIFDTFNPKTERNAPYQKYNPTDWVPATATYYNRTTTSDVMARVFVLLLACLKPKLEQALTRCPDCDDAFVLLSKHDLYKIFEVRFARASQGKLQVSRLFKMVSIDSSGDMIGHSQVAPYTFAKVGTTSLVAKWRGEISGLMAQRVGSFGLGPTSLLVRLSPVNGPY